MAYNPEEDIKVSDLPEKTTDVVSDDKLLVIDSEDANILKQVDASKVGGGGSGTGDMLKSVYDTNDNGIVDNAEALGGVPASDYAKSADVQPTLESGVNIKTINGNSILGPGNIDIQGGGGKMPVSIDIGETAGNLKYVFPETIGGVNTLPRAYKIEYIVHEYYPMTNPTWTKDHQGIGYINFTTDSMNVSTNPNDWSFGCFFDGEYHNDCYAFIKYDQNGAYSGSRKRVPNSIDSSGRCVSDIVNEGTISSSYGADVKIIRTSIF